MESTKNGEKKEEEEEEKIKAITRRLGSLVEYGKNWIKHPLNMAVLVWLFFVAAGLIVLGLLMTGLLDDAIKRSSQRKRWTEIVNQILNALFTIMCLYQHPKIAYHLIILCRWTSKDAAQLRMAYCKTLARRPHERLQMAFVILLLHLTCFMQYVLCALYWGWTSETRPDWAEYLCDGVGTAAPTIAGLYTVCGPLGTVLEAESDEESQKERSLEPARKDGLLLNEPEWVGGLLDCSDDCPIACFSCFCTCCVFGWNAERLGFGNVYVHTATFVLLCIAPLLVFSVTALNIDEETLKYTMAITGCVLCFFGLLYGGFWRIQMRKRFKLPENPFCCGYPAVTDCVQWLFCWSCALAQEVRTANFYEIDDGGFYRRNLEDGRTSLPLQREKVVEDCSLSDSMESAKDSVVEFLSLSIEVEMPGFEKDQATP